METITELAACFSSQGERGNRPLLYEQGVGWTWHGWKEFLEQYFIGLKGAFDSPFSYLFYSFWLQVLKMFFYAMQKADLISKYFIYMIFQVFHDKHFRFTPEVPPGHMECLIPWWSSEPWRSLRLPCLPWRFPFGCPSFNPSCWSVAQSGPAYCYKQNLGRYSHQCQPWLNVPPLTTSSHSILLSQLLYAPKARACPPVQLLYIFLCQQC